MSEIRHARGAARRRLSVGLTLAMCLGLFSLVSVRSAAAASSPCGPPVTSVIACENSLPGDPTSDWQVSGAGDPTLQGFATSMSVDVGQTESFKVSTPATAYHIDILRIGWYGGDGARKVVSDMLPTATLPQTQPACVNDTAPTGLVDCGNWAVSASWAVPSTAVSGLYVAHLVRDDGGGSDNGSLIPFVVRNDASHSDILFQTDDETWEAYNTWPGTSGNSLYQCSSNCPPGTSASYKGASEVSYNRPWNETVSGSTGWFMYAEYPMIRFLEENGFDVSYTSGVDMSQPGASSIIEQHKVYLTAGHDEYWSGPQRANVQAALNAGVSMAFFTGNETFWKTRFAPSIDGSNTPSRTLVTYKETHYNAPVDPQDPPTWTGSWMDPRFSPPADGGQPQNALTGQLFAVDSGSTDITVPAYYSKLRFWRNTRVATLAPGTTTTLAPGSDTLGYEWDVDADNGFRPAGEFELSSTTNTAAQPFTDYGSITTPAATSTVTHHLTLYRASSGALVFGAGTVQWSWGLDDAGLSRNTDPAMQQATVNLLADMGAQPATLMSGLAAATQSTDTTPPTSTITSPSSGASLADGSAVTISGTATDAGGGVVAGVEVSTDGGTTWHPVGTMSAPATSVTWSYSWIAHGNPTTTIKSRAVDDSGNLETPGAGVTVSVNCPCSIWGANVTPTTTDSGDPASIEVGVKFKTNEYGTITGIRFYKAGTNTGTHIGNLWTSTGTLLATATFTNESASGWQQVNFAQPVTVNPGTVYVASYFAPKGHYSDDGAYFYTVPQILQPESTVNSPPLFALQNTNGVTNGVYSYSGASTFPTSSNDASNYWVDPVFSPEPFTTPGQVGSVSATAGYSSASLSWAAPSGGPVTTYTITPYIGSTAQTPVTVTGNPAPTTGSVSGLTNGTSYTFTVTASDPAGAGAASAPSNAVTPSASIAHVTSVTPSSGATTVSVSVAPTATFSSAVTPNTVSFTVQNSSGNAVAGTVSFNGADTVATFTPTNPLTATSSYTATVSAPQNSPYTWSFSTGLACPCSVWQDGTPTGAVQSNDPNAQTSGIKFQASSNGYVAGVRFYKEPSDTGAHIGSLWSSTGTLLASGTFTNETASGWEELDFSAPVAVTAGTTYVASYFSSTGYPAATSAGLVSSVVNGPLTALAGGGVYVYGSSNTFPTSTYNNNNYWVDVVYSPTAGSSAPVVSTESPLAGATGVTVPVTPTATFSQPVTTSTVSFTVQTSGGSSVAGTVSFNSADTVATFTPSSALAGGTTYTATVSGAQNASGTPMGSPYSWTFTTAAAVQCPCSIWQNGTPTGAVQSNDPAAQTSGLRFQASTSGYITGVRFYKEPKDTGTHIGSLWSSTGTLLTSGTFTNETACGWEELDFSSPVAVTAGTTYVASYFSSTGYPAATSAGLASAVTNGPLTALAGGGVYAYGSSNTFPTGTYNNNNYWVDVVFTPTLNTTAPAAPGSVSATASNQSAAVSWVAPYNGGSTITSYTVTPYIGSAAQTPVTVSGSPPATSTTVTGLTNGTAYTFTVSATNAVGTGPTSPASNAVTPNTPPTVTAVTPTANSTGNVVSVAPTATFSQAVTPSTVSFKVVDSGGNSVAGTVSFNGANTVATFAPSASLGAGVTYTATVSGAQNSSGTAMSSPYSWSFTTAGPTCPCSIWQDGTTTGSFDSNDPNAQTSGLKFQVSSSGYIAGVRFYKESDDTGAHIGSLWSSTGTLLASGTFTNETASGWEELDFSAPVAVTAGTTYVASYFSSTGHPAATSAGLASAVTNGPITALAGGGVYAYGSSNTFPTSTYNNNNYWLDVVYSPTAGSTAPVVSTESPGSAATGVAASAAPTATFSQPVTTSTVSFTLQASGGSAVAGTVSFNSADTVATFTPSASLAGSTTYTATVSGAQNASGTPMASSFSWSFTTGAVFQCPCSVWQDGTPTGAVQSNDPNAQTSGLRFQVNSTGYITGVRFYKEPSDTGSHIGSLWSSTGTLLASGTFTNETASGWQELDFSSPVAVTAGTIYVASYFSSTGYPAATSAGLASAVTNGPLTALAGGGVYVYGSSNTFPTNTYNNNNYWVDAVFSYSP